MPTRAYSQLTLKEVVDDDLRIITGIASTPSTDRYDDIVEPKGAVFKLPLPFLWQHNSRQPVGWVTKAKATKDGIEVEIQIAKIPEPGMLQEEIDYAWQQLKYGLVRGLSIGFNPIESANIDGNYGRHYLKWEWLELSAVTIAANQDASIQTIKSIVQQQIRAASGQKDMPVVRTDNKPGVSGTTPKPTIKKGMTMTLQEQIAALEAKRAAHVARLTDISTKAAGEGRTKDDGEREEFNTLKAELISIDAELSDLRDVEKYAVKAASPLPVNKAVGVTNGNGGTPDPAAEASAARGGYAVAKLAPKLAPGIEFARFVMCLGAAKGDLATAAAIGQKRFPDMERVNLVLKAAVAAGTTTDATWAAPLVEYNQFAGDFVEFLRPQTILGRFGQGNVPDLRRIPFNVHIRGQTSGGAGYWVGQGKPKPVTKFNFNDAYHGFTKVANIAVLTEELLRFSNPSAEALVRDALAAALIERLDIDFIDPAKAAAANVSPASITNGVSPIGSSGNDADAVRTDIAALWAVADDTNLPATSAVYITDSKTVRRLSLMRNALGQVEFPGLTMTGGTLDGVPVIVSNYVPDNSNGSLFILAFASEIYLSDDNVVTVDASREASIQMLDDPTNDTSTPTPTTMVSMFQTNSVALRAERYINWSKRRSQAVAYLNNVNWGIGT